MKKRYIIICDDGAIKIYIGDNKDFSGVDELDRIYQFGYTSYAQAYREKKFLAQIWEHVKIVSFNF